MRASYTRVAPAEQNLAGQREVVDTVDKEFQKISTRSRIHRTELEDCFDYLREHDQMGMASIDWLSDP